MENSILQQLDKVLQDRKGQPSETSYVASLYNKGLDSILKKIGEEAAETIMAAKDADKEQIIYEVADLWFHSLILLAQQDLTSDAVLQELQRRFGLSGITEKSQRK